MIPLFECITFKVSETVEWKPGEMRSNKNRIGPNVRYPMHKDASGDLVIGGGIAVRSQIKYGGMSEPEPVPLDGARGPYRHGAQETQEPLKKAYGPFEFDSYADPEYWEIDAVPGKPGMGNLRKRILDAVIPVNVRVPIPPPVAPGVSRMSTPNISSLQSKAKIRWSTSFPAIGVRRRYRPPPAVFGHLFGCGRVLQHLR